MERFGRLAQIIHERAVPPPRSGPPQRVFVKSPWVVAAPLHWPLALTGVAVWAWSHGRENAALLLAAGIAWSLVSAARAPWRVRVLDDAIAIDHLGRSRRMAFADITDVRLHEVREYGKGRMLLADMQAVDILTAHGLSVRLAGFRDGSLALYRALEDVWRGAATTRA